MADARVTLRQVLKQGVLHELIPMNPVDRAAGPEGGAEGFEGALV